MKALRFGLVGAGFWAKPQLAAWQEVRGAECVAVCDLVRPKAEALARRFAVRSAYDDAEEMLRRESLDFVDVVAGVEAHAPLVKLAAARGLPVVCQKPMATSLAEGEEMVEACRKAGVPFLIHENLRWYHTIREVKAVIDGGTLGRVFRGRIDYCNAYPLFDNQPYLRSAPQLILADMGTHILDIARFLFGEARDLACQLQRVTPGIEGEDVATVMMTMGAGTTVLCQLSYATVAERDSYPEVLCFVEGEAGSVELAADYRIRVTTREGTRARRLPPPPYPWVEPGEGIGQTCIVPCHRHLLQALRGEAACETTGADNLKTLRLVFASYESARRRQVVQTV